MIKGVIILKGDKSGKKAFQDVIMKRFWIWNINPKNNLEQAEKILSIPDERDEKHSIFSDKFLDLLNEYYDYSYHYCQFFINKLTTSMKAQENNLEGDLVIIHGVDHNLSKRLQDDFGVYSITLGSHYHDDSDFVMNYTDENFERDVVKLIFGLFEEKEVDEIAS